MRFKKFFNENFLREYDEFVQKLSDDDKLGLIKYSSNKINWYGDPDEMILIHKDDVFYRTDNIFYGDKLKQLKQLIKSSGGIPSERVDIVCSYGYGQVIDFEDIQQQLSGEGGFNTPLTTGDDELDDYLENKEDYLESEFDVYDIYEVATEFMFMGSSYNYDESHRVEALDEFKKSDSFLDAQDDDEEEEYLNEVNRFLDLEQLINKSIKENIGDFGKFVVQVRDGNHRVRSAIETGEHYVCINLSQKRESTHDNDQVRYVRDL